MALISLHSISISYGGPRLLENVSLNIEQGQRICILGRNGVGKSTFMKIVAGLEKPDTGEIVSVPGLVSAYMSQDVPICEGGSVFEVVALGAGEIGKKFVQWQKLAHDRNAGEVQTLHDELEHHGGWQIETRTRQALDRVGIRPDLEFSSLSSGMRRRVYLARALAQDPNLLLLDEPTNHLDIDSIAWLERFLIGSRLTVLFVTHDRRLLKRIATRIVEIDRGKLLDWACDYETFLSRKQAVLDAEEKEWDRFDDRLRQEEAWIRKGVRARQTRNEGRVRALERMRAGRSKRREQSGVVSMRASEAGRSGTRVIEARSVTFGYGSHPVVNDFSMSIGRGDRIGIVGPNGCGKTTLLNLLLGKIAPQCGSVSNGVNLEISYFDQLRMVLDPNKSAWENVVGTGDTVIINGAPRHVISYLQDFLFPSDQIRSPVGRFSGGERNRLMLAKMFTQPANVLVFDEPTNDLDAETLDLLEELLANFNGTVLVVSHDREFLNNVVTSMLVYEGNGIFKEYIGGYDDWQRQRARKDMAKPAQKTVPRQEAQQADVPQGAKKRSFKENNELRELPEKIEALERESATIHAQMSDLAFFSKPGFISNAKDRIKVIESDIAAYYERWQELDSRPGK